MQKIRLLTVGFAALALALSVTACSSNGDGEDTQLTEEAKSEVVSSGSIGAATENPDEVLEYWTPEREEEAIPRDIERDGEAPEPVQGGPQAGPFDDPDDSGPEGGTPGTAPSAGAGESVAAEEFGEPAIGAATPDKTNWKVYAGKTTKLPFRQVGVLFYVDPSDGKPYTCSAAVVASPSKSLVWTAGHCVHDGEGNWMEKMKFVPGYQGGAKPYGEWPVKMQPGPLLFSTNGWTVDGDFDYDFGAVVVAPRNGKLLEDVVGGQGLRWNVKRLPPVVDLGYPAHPSPPFEFQKGPYRCGSRVVVRDQGQPKPLGLDCYLGQGASGGPWIVDYQPKRGWGYVVSVNSYGYNDTRTYFFGPYPGQAVASLFNAAKDK